MKAVIYIFILIFIYFFTPLIPCPAFVSALFINILYLFYTFLYIHFDVCACLCTTLFKLYCSVDVVNIDVAISFIFFRNGTYLKNNNIC